MPSVAPSSPPHPGARRASAASGWLAEFGGRSSLARQCIAAFCEVLDAGHESAVEESYQRWRAEWHGWSSEGQGPEVAMARLGRALHLPAAAARPASVLFAVQSYYALCAKLRTAVALTAARRSRVSAGAILEQWRRLETGSLLGSASPAADGLQTYTWYLDSRAPEVHLALKRVVHQFSASAAVTRGGESLDPLRDLYHHLLPPQIRRALGEFYTPDWLVAHVLDQLAFVGDPAQRILDPTCGSGAFLIEALRRTRRWQAVQRPSQDVLDWLPGSFGQIAGCDRQPLAVLAARANYMAELPEADWEVQGAQLPVYRGDTVCDEPPLGQFPLIAGNPPWMVWDRLPTAYREQTKPLWHQYGLFNLSARDARHGGGKKDLAALLLYVCADRFLADGGRLGFVMTQTLFQTRRAGEGFRRFRLGATGPFLAVERVDDLSAVRPFADAANWTSTLVIRKGTPTQFPVPYYQWSCAPGKAGRANPGSMERCRCEASPVDPRRSESPWAIRPLTGDPTSGSTLLAGPADYHGHLGANTGGANGVYWLEILGRDQELLRVRNRALGKRAVGQVEAVLEAALVHPLLRWSGLSRFRARADGYLLLPQDASRRSGIELSQMQQRFPKALSYLQRFETPLRSRAAYRRYQSRGPFYSIYDVGPYTLAPWKVVWRRMDRQLTAAVLEPYLDAWLGPRSLVPQESCALIAAASADEAHYLCAILNSAPANGLVQAHSVRGGKGFGTPGMLDYLPIRRYDPENGLHVQLAELSRQAHLAAAAEAPSSNFSSQLDARVGALWGELTSPTHRGAP